MSPLPSSGCRDRDSRQAQDEEAVVAPSYRIPSYRVGCNRLFVGAWKHGLSVYGWHGSRADSCAPPWTPDGCRDQRLRRAEPGGAYRRTVGLVAVAVLSDIHGVLPALVAVLAEPDVRRAERIVLTGDVAAGPQPRATLDLLSALGERAVWVRGNADRELVALARGELTEVGDPLAEWAATELTDDDLALLDALPHPVTLDVDGFGPALFCHGSPRADDEVVLVDSRLSWWAEVLAGVDPAVTTIVGGHTHMQFVRAVGGRLVVNPGSVGMPYGPPGAHWALLDSGAVSLRRTLLDVEAACAAVIAGSGFPDVRAWVNDILRHPAGDLEALTGFAPRDGRQP